MPDELITPDHNDYFLQDNFCSKLYKKEQKNISKRLELNKVIMKDFGEL